MHKITLLEAAIRQTLLRKNVSRGNLSKFNGIKLSRYTILHIQRHKAFAPIKIARSALTGGFFQQCQITRAHLMACVASEGH